MSWPVAAYGLLGLALAAGFVWWERTRPDAKVIALVGALAALATLGRMAFAAVPNVKPTTDIVIIAGFALGGAPGFTVGAVAALASNFFFGQGPWTPWQMLGWGLCGVIGACLPRVAARRIPLAVVCAILGFAFTAFQDLGDWVTYSGGHTLAQLGAYLSSGIGFDVISGASSAGFALIFGPGLARSLARFRLRLDVQWVGAPLLALVAVGALLSVPAHSAQASNRRATPAEYLEHAPLSTPLYSGWAALGLEADGVTPPTRLIAYIRRTQATDPGSIERSILLLAPLSEPVTTLLKRLHFAPSIQDQTNLTAFGVLALRAAGRPVPARTLAWLRAQEDSDGGFNFATRGAASDIDDTGAVLEALGDVRRAVSYLDAHENSDGGFPSEPGQPSNAQSTAFAVQGLIAAGRHPARAIAYLKSLRQPDGSIDYAKSVSETPEWVTGEALMAIVGQPLPLSAISSATASSTTVVTPAPRTTAGPAPATTATPTPSPTATPAPSPTATPPPSPTAGSVSTTTPARFANPGPPHSAQVTAGARGAFRWVAGVLAFLEER
jgi:energy-coupling factor transport system substrate-specific component